MSLLNILGLYTSKQYNSVKDNLTKYIVKCNDLEKQIRDLKKFEETNGKLIKENVELQKELDDVKIPEVETVSTKYYMIIQAKDYYYRFEDEEYINVFKAPSTGIGDLVRAVCQNFTKKTGKEKIKFTEFNDEVTYMYQHQDELSSEDKKVIRAYINNLHRIDTAIDTQDNQKEHYEYKNGILCYKDGWAVYPSYR